MSFRPLLRPVALGVHLLAVVLVSAALGLGLWQVDSWQQVREDEASNSQQLEPLPLDEALGPDQPFPKKQVGRPVLATGTWLPDSTIYVSGRPHGSEEGYWAMTPLAVDDGGPVDSAPALLVARGWVSEPDQAPAPPSGPAEIVGWLQPPEGAAGVTDEDRSDDVIPQVRMADAIQHVDQDLYGGYVVLDVEAPALNAGADGLRPADLSQLPEVAASTGLKNLLYAIEWAVFAAFAAFIWWRWCMDEIAAERRTGDAAGDTAGDTAGTLSPPGSLGT